TKTGDFAVMWDRLAALALARTCRRVGGMRNIGCGRRRVLGGLVFCAAGGWRLGSSAAQPAGRGALPTRRIPTVVIDPGHGGVDPGAISPSGIHEKDIALATAWEFARQLA